LTVNGTLQARQPPAQNAAPVRVPAPGAHNPQRHLTPAVPVRAPSGLGLDSEGVRARMVERLRRSGGVDEAVLSAMAAVPRHLFVDTALANQAYEDTSLPIGLGQTISKPSVVARMISLLRAGREPQGLGKTLEVGSGCGYQAVLLSLLARDVISIERLHRLHEKARATVAVLRRPNLRLIHGDGMLGHPPSAPYDSIICAASGEDLPAAWLAQLAPGGRLVAPARQGAGQALVVVDHVDGRFERRWLDAVHFVPLKSGTT